MKSTNSTDENSKASQNKSSKKSTKSRSKSSKASNAVNSTNSNTTPNNYSTSITVTTPTTPTSTTSNVNFEGTPTTSAGGTLDGSSGSSSSGSRGHHKNYAGFEPRSIKIIWEQHDQSDIELSQEVCTRLAEDASYKIWELVNNIKTFARHSGGVVTYDLVNEVLRDADVPPALGAMDSAWDRVDYDGSFFFYSDKILELRDEYQREVNIEVPDGADFVRSWIVEDKHVESLRLYIPSLIYVTLHGDNSTFDTVLREAAFSSIIGSCYRVLLAKLIQILAFKQADRTSSRCWSLLRACAVNPYVQEVDCREEHFHLAEILICQLIGPLECIKVHNENSSKSEQKTDSQYDVKMENGIRKVEAAVLPQQQSNLKLEVPYSEAEQQSELQQQQQEQNQQPVQEINNIFRLQSEEDGTNDADVDLNTSTSSATSTIVNTESMQASPYFATPIDIKYIEDLCATLGILAETSGYFQSECIFLIIRRLKRFFVGREVNTAKEYNYIGRAVRGLVALGEYAFREFIPFIYKFRAEDIPESIWNDFALSAIYLHGPDDIFLYEWLEYVCGGDKLQPFMVYYAEYYEKLLTKRFLQRKQPTFKINSKLGVRRLEWSTLAAAMCHGDDPSKAIKPKPCISEVFPKLTLPNLRLNRSGNIRFKFAGCRPVILKPKTNGTRGEGGKNGQHISGINVGQHDILIAKRKLLKPLSNERRMVNLSSYFYVRV